MNILGSWSSASSLTIDISHRADIEGAADSVSAPQLPSITRTHLPIYSTVQSTKVVLRSNDLLHTLSSSNFGPELKSTLLDLSRFSQAIDFAFSHPEVSLHPRAFDEDTILIQHRLLSTTNVTESELATACRLGALIYVKTLTREAPFFPSSSKVVIPKLKSLLARIVKESRATPLLLWLYFMGGIASQGLGARSWFMNGLLGFVLLPGELLTWMSVKKALRKVLWIELIHEGPCKQLWDETEVTRATTSIGQD
jgi:Fungal specific transcription factor domain